MNVKLIEHWAPLDMTEALAGLPLEQQTIRMFGKLIPMPRLTCWMGDAPYRYSGMTFQPVEWSEPMARLRDAVEREAGSRFNSVLANFYRTGDDHISWHADDELGLGPVIASVSFGATRRFQFRRREGGAPVAEYELGNGALLVMGEGVQRDYQHRVPKQRGTGARLSLTFRHMSTVAM